MWKWFDQIDSIYGSRPESNGTEGALDSATSLLENTMEDVMSQLPNSLKHRRHQHDRLHQQPPAPAGHQSVWYQARGNGTCTIRSILLF
ncbi:uncharacterized protein LOC143742519 isoform X2 [Siphateles boraxobius]|uniref:uncharacterized protein LOC143742519 isoform X2 n=1 Tax=Siphateles boraxobius TaxID=180520 RepID=UPI00406283AB